VKTWGELMFEAWMEAGRKVRPNDPNKHAYDFPWRNVSPHLQAHYEEAALRFVMKRGEGQPKEQQPDAD
jgi:hypothetical protein